MSYPNFDGLHEDDIACRLEWEELSAILYSAQGDHLFCQNLRESVEQHFSATLKIIGTRYFLIFASADDFMLFKLRWL